MDHDDISCQHFIRTMAEYLAGELCADDEGRTRLHLEGCPDCATYLRNYELTMRIGRESRSDDRDAAPPESLVADILAARRRMR